MIFKKRELSMGEIHTCDIGYPLEHTHFEINNFRPDRVWKLSLYNRHQPSHRGFFESFAAAEEAAHQLVQTMIVELTRTLNEV